MAPITRMLKWRTITLLSAPTEEYINEILESHLQNPADNQLSQSCHKEEKQGFCKVCFSQCSTVLLVTSNLSQVRDKMLIYWVQHKIPGMDRENSVRGYCCFSSLFAREEHPKVLGMMMVMLPSRLCRPKQGKTVQRSLSLAPKNPKP